MEAFLKATARSSWDTIDIQNEAVLGEIEDQDLRMLMEPVSDEDEGSESGGGYSDGEDEEDQYEDKDQLDDDYESDNVEHDGNVRIDSKVNDDDEDAEPKRLSSFERAQQKLRHTIAQLERENVAERPWNMLGEVSAKQRPLDSLLQEDLDFERASRPAPVHTEETTGTIESIIKQRIKDRAFDNVERPASRAAANAPSSKRKLPELEEGKSGKSLTEVIEAEYEAARNPKTLTSVDAKTLEIHNELRVLFGKLSARLDALSSSTSNAKFVPVKHSLAAPTDSDLAVTVKAKKKSVLK